MNGHSLINTVEATEHLKNILKLNVKKVESTAVNLSTLSSNNCKVEEAEKSSEITQTSGFEGAKNKNFASIYNMEKSNSAVNFRNENMFQKVELNGEDNIPIYGTDVTVVSSPLHRPASLKIMMHNVVDFGWEYRSCVGRIVSVHLSMKYLAYSLKSPVSDAGFVRVIKQKEQDTQDSLLIRGFKGILKDLAFAHSLTKVILACVDEFGQLLVYEILDNGSDLSYQLLIHIARKEGPSATAYHRIVWCPYVPDESGSDDDMTTLLCLTQDEKAEVLKIDSVMKGHDKDILYFETLKTDGYLTMSYHKQPITAAAFSPDGIALATASLDGEVKFFQINIQESSKIPKYLHEWIPHGGKPLSCLFFLDNIKNSHPDVQFWKFAITGADNNQELKLWSCKTWLCLQTINFKPNPNDTTMPLLKAELDLTGRYFFLSDIGRKVLYVLRIRQETMSGQSFISSLSEYALKFPVLNIVCISVSKSKSTSSVKANENEDDDDDDEKDEEDDDDSDDLSEPAERRTSVDHLIKLYWVTTKSLQSCRVIYQLKSESPILSISSAGSSQESFVYRDGLNELLNAGNENMNIVDIVDSSSSTAKCLTPVDLTTVLTSPSAAAATVASLGSEHSYYKGCDDVLLTPKDFTSVSHTSLPPSNISNAFKLSSVEESALCSTLEVKTSQDNVSPVSPDINSCIRRKSSQHSSSSSPSREVAEILSPRQLRNHDTLTPNEEKESELIMIESNNPHTNDGIHNSSPVTRTFPSNEWPQAPDPHKEYKVSSRSDSDVRMPHVMDQQEHCRHSLPPLNDDVPSPIIGNNGPFYNQRMEQEMKSLNCKIALVIENARNQSQELQYIRNNLHETEQQNKFSQNNIQNFVSVASNLLAKIEQMSTNTNLGYAGIENRLDKWENSELIRTEHQNAAFSQQLLSDISQQLDKLVKQEIKTSVIPHVTGYIDTTVARMQEAILQKLNATDSTIKDCLTRHVKSKAFADNFALTLTGVVQPAIHDSSKDTFQACVIPAFEKSCHMLMKQLNEIFSTGTAEYVQHMERNVATVCNSLNTCVENVQTQLHKITSEVNGALSKHCVKLQDHAIENAKQNDLLISKIRLAVQEEMNKSLRSHQVQSVAAMRSQTASPAIHAKNEQSITWNEIFPLINNGQINEAFQQALTAVDLDLLIKVCEYVSVDRVFGLGPCPLAQHVLLSLIHQLVMSDLSEKTELKVDYIEDALASLDSNNSLTQQHIGPIVKIMEQKITAFMQKHPNHPLNRHFRRIILSSKSLLK